MGPLLITLLPLLTPQDPAPGQEPAPPPAVAAMPDEAHELFAAERAGEAAELTTLTRLTHSDDAATAVRAVWLLARNRDAQRFGHLAGVVMDNPHPDARVLAMQTLFRHGGTDSVDTAIKALDDVDRRVRTLGAQLLGKLRPTTAVQPLLAMLDQQRDTEGPGPATDLQAALLALHDLGAADQMLRAATSIQDGKAQGTGPTLAYCLQSLSPRLPRNDEINLLVATLDHKEMLVRRYAITRLAELADAGTIGALEGRLGREGKELRALLEAALAQVRRDNQPAGDLIERSQQNLDALLARTEQAWQRLPADRRAVVVGIPFAFFIIAWLMMRRRRRIIAAAAAAETMALVQPSAEYLEQLAEEANDVAQELDAESTPEDVLLATDTEEPAVAAGAWDAETVDEAGGLRR